jgi:predicted dehydrogenase
MSVLVAPRTPPPSRKHLRKPRLGFLGVGWIGRNRLEAIAHSDIAEIVALADASPEMISQASSIAPDSIHASSLAELLQLDLDGIVIATPSALHAEQAIRALEKGIAVFCQKPLARTYRETEHVLAAARNADKLLGVDLSYRCIRGISEMRKILQSGELGKVYAADLVFHNAYGPDKQWFYDPKLSGGGCVIDLGIHLVDLALWFLDFPEVENVTSRLFAQGEPITAWSHRVEDFGTARIDLENGASIQVSCSWKLPAGCDAKIRASFYGTNGGVEFRNVNGSFYEFVAERFFGTRRGPISTSQKDWGGCAAVEWARELADGNGFDPEIEHIADVAEVLDQIYANSRK